MKQFTFNFSFIETGCCHALMTWLSLHSQADIKAILLLLRLGSQVCTIVPSSEQACFQGMQTLVRREHRHPGWQLNIMDNECSPGGMSQLLWQPEWKNNKSLKSQGKVEATPSLGAAQGIAEGQAVEF